MEFFKKTNTSYSQDNNPELSVRGMSRVEIGKIVSDFIDHFLSIVIDNSQFVLLINVGGTVRPFYISKSRASSRKYHYSFFSSSNDDDELSHQIMLTRLTRGIEEGDFVSRHWKIRLQKVAHMKAFGNSRKVTIVGMESKDFGINNEDFSTKLIASLVENEEGYIRVSAIKRFMKEYRRYQVENTYNNLLNVWMVINRLMVLSVVMGTVKSEFRSIDSTAVPLRFSLARNDKARKTVNYKTVWDEYLIKNVSV